MKILPRLRCVSVFAAALLVTSACTSPEPPKAAAPRSAEAAPPPAPAPSESPASTGLLSEEAFKAMHELRGDKAPPARGQMVDVGAAHAYLSLPKDAKPKLPGVVVIHEWWGLNDHIKHWSDRLADDGYAALAVDLYGGKVATTPDEAMAAMKAVDTQAAIQTLRAAHRMLVTDPRILAPRTASIGWCFGGGFSLQLALNEPELDAAVMYYGRPVTEPPKLKAIRAPLLGVFANQDKGIPPSTVDEFDKALGEAGVAHELLRYEADHAFANPSGARYNSTAAADAWEHVRKFLAQKLKG